MKRKRYGDSADVHTQKATTAARRVRDLEGSVVADAAAGHCGLAVGGLFQLQRALGAAVAHAGAGGRVATNALQDASMRAGRAFLKFCMVSKKR